MFRKFAQDFGRSFVESGSETEGGVRQGFGGVRVTESHDFVRELSDDDKVVVTGGGIGRGTVTLSDNIIK